MLPLAVIASFYYMIAKTGAASSTSSLNRIKRKNFGIFLEDVLIGCWIGNTDYFIAQWTLGIELFASFFIYLIALTIVNYRQRLFFVYMPVMIFIFAARICDRLLITEYKLGKGVLHFPMFLIGMLIADAECYPSG